MIEVADRQKEAGPPSPQQFDVVVVGGGLAGLYALHRLRSLGLTVRAYEAGSGVGGTWFWNRYPGARCDVESLEYSYSFSEDLQQSWKWPERYGGQPDILRYINHVADHFDLRRDVQLDTRVTAATFDRTANRWEITTDRGETVSSQFCVMATGNLSAPRVPDFEGLEEFRGNWYHSSRWPQQGVDFSGLRVAVIGTGASGIQMIPLIAAQADHLTVFQRTANFSLPARNEPLSADKERRHKASYTDLRIAALETPFGIGGYPPPVQSALEATDEERQRHFESKWAEGGAFSFLYAYSDLLTNAASNETASEFVRGKIRSIVQDPSVADALTPKDHPIGTKRVCLDTHYYETYNRDNVSLVDVKTDQIAEITAHGLKTGKREYGPFDSIVFATGFDAMTGALREIDIRVRDGATLVNEWAHGPRTYLGLMVAGLPNLFIVTGPGSPSVKAQMILAIEQHTNWIADCIRYLRASGHRKIEADQAAQDEWVDHVNEVADATLYPLANSWYIGANIPGKPRVFMPYVGGFGRYKKKCDAVVTNGYEGFSIS